MNLDQSADKITPSTGALTVAGTVNSTNIPTTGTVLASTTAPATNPATGTPSASTYLRGDGTWASVSATTATNLAGGALGSVPYQLLSDSTTFLTGNTTTTPQFLTSTGVAGVATAPTYTGSTGSGSVVLATSPTLVTPALGTPSALVGTNITGTASGLSIGGTAATATNVAGSGITGSRGIPKAAMPAGTVLQVLSTVLTTSATTTSSTMVTTGLAVSITPSSSTSKIYVSASLSGSQTNSNGSAYFTILRGATDLGNTNGLNVTYTNASYSNPFRIPVAMEYLDSPATASAVTYTVYFKNNTVGTVGLNNDSTSSVITVMEIAA